MKKKLLFLLDHFEEIVLVQGFALMLLIGFGNVLSRFVLHVVSCNRRDKETRQRSMSAPAISPSSLMSRLSRAERTWA